ncbi:MAG: sulfotransferase domain-containing protein [Pirellulales bacterium]|nr:sulfotransferase domain-containing protein [Pirellulales bacterium]
MMVCSMPKAGTYFIAEALRLLGCEPTHLHLDHNVVWDYRQRTIKEIRADSFRYMVEMPLEQSLCLVRPGQFAVGHIECCSEAKRQLRGFKKILVYRDLRDALISQMRFLKDTNCGGPTMDAWKDLPEGPMQMAGFFRDEANVGYMFAKFRGMAVWLHEPDVLHLSFEVLYGDQGREAQSLAIEKLCEFLDTPTPPDESDDVMATLIGRPTRTWSGQRSSRKVYWNDNIENMFRAAGGHETNASLGYRQRGISTRSLVEQG